MKFFRTNLALTCLAGVMLSATLGLAQTTSPGAAGTRTKYGPDGNPATTGVAPAKPAAEEEASSSAAETGQVDPAAKADPSAKPAPAKPVASSSSKGIRLSPLTPVAKSVNVHDKVLAECRLQSLLPQSIAERSPDVKLSDGGGALKLELTIVDIHAPSGGWFSGPKWITVEGRLLQGRTVKGSFIAKETSMASATACGMLSKVVRVLASDIVIWLENPTKGARLGSAR